MQDTPSPITYTETTPLRKRRPTTGPASAAPPAKRQSPPSLDEFVRVRDVPAWVDEPLDEAYVHNTNVIARQIKRRQTKALDRIREDMVSALVSASSSANNHDPIAPARTSSLPARPPLPPIDWRDLIRGVVTNPGAHHSSVCLHTSCPYSKGPLMDQRYELTNRLHQINIGMYGREIADTLLAGRSMLK